MACHQLGLIIRLSENYRPGPCPLPTFSFCPRHLAPPTPMSFLPSKQGKASKGVFKSDGPLDDTRHCRFIRRPLSFSWQARDGTNERSFRSCETPLKSGFADAESPPLTDRQTDCRPLTALMLMGSKKPLPRRAASAVCSFPADVVDTWRYNSFSKGPFWGTIFLPH